MQVSQDKRLENQPRTSQVLPVTLSAGLIQFEGETINLSENGFAARTSCLPEVGDTFSCAFASEEEGNANAGTCQVIWAKQSEQNYLGEIGFQFLKHTFKQDDIQIDSPTFIQSDVYSNEVLLDESIAVETLEKSFSSWLQNRTLRIQAVGGVDLFLGQADKIELQETDRSCLFILHPEGWESPEPCNAVEKNFHTQLLQQTQNILHERTNASEPAAQLSDPQIQKEPPEASPQRKAKMFNAFAFLRFIQILFSKKSSSFFSTLKTKSQLWHGHFALRFVAFEKRNTRLVKTVSTTVLKKIEKNSRTLKRFLTSFLFKNDALNPFRKVKSEKKKRTLRKTHSRVQNIRQEGTLKKNSFGKILILGIVFGASLYGISNTFFNKPIASSDPSSGSTVENDESSIQNQYQKNQNENLEAIEVSQAINSNEVEALRVEMEPLQIGSIIAQGTPKQKSAFTLRLSKKPGDMVGIWDNNVMTITIPEALSFDKAGPIAQAHPSLLKASIFNYGDYSILKLHFKNKEAAIFEIKAQGAELQVILDKLSFVETQEITHQLSS